MISDEGSFLQYQKQHEFYKLCLWEQLNSQNKDYSHVSVCHMSSLYNDEILLILLCSVCHLPPVFLLWVPKIFIQLTMWPWWNKDCSSSIKNSHSTLMLFVINCKQTQQSSQCWFMNRCKRSDRGKMLLNINIVPNGVCTLLGCPCLWSTSSLCSFFPPSFFIHILFWR